MTFIETVPEHEAEGALAGYYAADRELRGYLPNYTQAFSAAPEVYGAWRQLVGAVTGLLDARTYELATLAAARRLQSSYCSLAHGTLLADKLLEPDEARAFVVEGRADTLDERERAVVELAEQVVDDATAVTQQDVDRLKAAGLTDVEVLGVVAAAGMRCFFSKTLDALGAAPDAAYQQLDPELREALTVGRPIDA